MDHSLRRKRLAARLPDLGVDAVLVTHLPNVRYLTGFTGSNGHVVVGTGGCSFITDGRYTEQARHEVPDVERITYLDGFERALSGALGDLGVARLGFEAPTVTYRSWARLDERLDGIELVPTDDEVERLRWVKDAEELRLLEHAQEATDQAFDEILEKLALGMTERQVAFELELAMRRAGGDGLSFETIVAFGDNAAEPHHEPNHRTLGEGDIIKLDFGALWGGYHADMTRTIAFGRPPDELRAIHGIVRAAQQAGIDAARAGVTGADVDAASRGVIEEAGYGDRFTHGLGHGVGLEIHEGPRLMRGGDQVLPVGAVVTVEPGIYVAGLGGVRIEDMVEVTDDGCRVMPTTTKELIEL
ncbi:MAG TPA: Xaa-Pro peptidase family protein [Actinomycetota bacterium]|jgi:Xaa-Pro dipeptidase|nr:Xaa-Pro peptidase family protein [Actinomycetota bacterium]